MSSKYSADSSRYVNADTALTDHAIFRFNERTPQDFDMDPAHCWELGESIKHPIVCASDDHDTPPLEVRVFVADGWGLAFLVVRDHAQYGAPRVVATVNHIRGFGHEATRAYLWSHGPHIGGESDA